MKDLNIRISLLKVICPKSFAPIFSYVHTSIYDSFLHSVSMLRSESWNIFASSHLLQIIWSKSFAPNHLLQINSEFILFRISFYKLAKIFFYQNCFIIQIKASFDISVRFVYDSHNFCFAR